MIAGLESLLGCGRASSALWLAVSAFGSSTSSIESTGPLKRPATVVKGPSIRGFRAAYCLASLVGYRPRRGGAECIGNSQLDDLGVGYEHLDDLYGGLE